MKITKSTSENVKVFHHQEAEKETVIIVEENLSESNFLPKSSSSPKDKNTPSQTKVKKYDIKKKEEKTYCF